LEIKHRVILGPILIFLSCLLFLISMIVSRFEFESLTRNPTIGPPASILDDMGAKNTAKIQAGEWWRLITPVFLHAGLIHLFLNMVMVLRLGFSMEEAFGSSKVASIYFASGVSGVVCSAVFLKNQLSVGASGALYGLLGALLADIIQNYKSKLIVMRFLNRNRLMGY
jgi:membrane associated rhomboid family serine protease